MGFLPKSRTARRRLTIVSIAGSVLVVAGVLVFLGLGESVSMFYLPHQAIEAKVPAGRSIQLGGFVKPGSVVKHADGRIDFVVIDCTRVQSQVAYVGDLPDLFREGQGVVAKGAFAADGAFKAKEVLAKHDERYMPRDLSNQLKKSGGGASMGGKEGTMAYEQACGTGGTAA